MLTRTNDERAHALAIALGWHHIEKIDAMPDTTRKRVKHALRDCFKKNMPNVFLSQSIEIPASDLHALHDWLQYPRHGLGEGCIPGFCRMPGCILCDVMK